MKTLIIHLSIHLAALSAAFYLGCNHGYVVGLNEGHADNILKGGGCVLKHNSKVVPIP